MVTFDILEGCASHIEGACSWSEDEMATILASATLTGTRLAETLNTLHPGWNLTPSQAFILVYGGSVNFKKMGGENRGYWGETFLRDGGVHEIEVYPDTVGKLVGDEHWAVHELGHAFVNAVAGKARPLYWLMIHQAFVPGFPDRPLSPNDPAGTWGFAGPRWKWQRSDQGRRSEEFADMYLGWVYNEWEPGRYGAWSEAGQMRADFMNYYMPLWVNSGN